MSFNAGAFIASTYPVLFGSHRAGRLHSRIGPTPLTDDEFRKTMEPLVTYQEIAAENLAILKGMAGHHAKLG